MVYVRSFVLNWKGGGGFDRYNSQHETVSFLFFIIIIIVAIIKRVFYWMKRKNHETKNKNKIIKTKNKQILIRNFRLRIGNWHLPNDIKTINNDKTVWKRARANKTARTTEMEMENSQSTNRPLCLPLPLSTFTIECIARHSSRFHTFPIPSKYHNLFINETIENW